MFIGFVGFIGFIGFIWFRGPTRGPVLLAPYWFVFGVRRWGLRVL